MDNTLIVCYSYTGTTLRLAELLSSHEGWPLARIHDAEPRAGGSGTLRCVLDSLLRRRPRIRYEGPDPGGFDAVVLLAPVWMYRLASPMRSFVARYRDQLPRVAVICTMNAGGGSNALAEVARLLGHSPVASACFLQREVDDGSGMSRLLALGDALQPGARPQVRPPADLAAHA